MWLAEDEVHKVLAAESYRQGDFIVNAEHPMSMKLLATGIVQDGRRYFENVERIDRIERTYAPEKEIRIGGIPAVRIYKIHGFLHAGTNDPGREPRRN